MARVIVSKEARSDLVSIRDYIRDELLSPDAAQRILAELKKSITSKSKGAPSRMRLCCVCALKAR